MEKYFEEEDSLSFLFEKSDPPVHSYLFLEFEQEQNSNYSDFVNHKPRDDNYQEEQSNQKKDENSLNVPEEEKETKKSTQFFEPSEENKTQSTEKHENNLKEIGAQKISKEHKEKKRRIKAPKDNLQRKSTGDLNMSFFLFFMDTLRRELKDQEERLRLYENEDKKEIEQILKKLQKWRVEFRLPCAAGLFHTNMTFQRLIQVFIKERHWMYYMKKTQTEVVAVFQRQQKTFIELLNCISNI